ncbi:class I SAM-dependent DNA methyltransferase [Qipengyuania sp. SM2507]
MTVEELIAEWWGKPGGQEKSNFAAFIPHLCSVLDVPTPGPIEKGAIGAYGYEASVPRGSFRSLKGTGAIDLYKRGHFIMEAKQSYLKPEQAQLDLSPNEAAPRAPSGAHYDKLMRDARLQAENYAKNLPVGEPVCPFLIVCDVGRAFELYVDTAGNGRGYKFFPDKQSYRIELPQLASDAQVGSTGKTALELLHAIWTAPRTVDPRHLSADVTRTVAANLASVSKYLEEGIRIRVPAGRERQEEIEEASLFLMRVLFCMFAEDIGLLPEDRFKQFLKRAEANDDLFRNGLADLFQKMNSADPANRFAHAVEANVRYFNGRLFENNRTYPLGGFVIHDLYEAARQNWRKVEPAIFGTLLEQALNPEERAKLGAHYTPRPYVELLVRATIMDVLEPEWEAIEELPEADILAAATSFHAKLGQTRVLDPACGTGNFLYVAMELMQELEARVIERIQTLGGEAEPKVGPHQFHGLELNPRAAKIAELVLWIGWLRNRLDADPDNVPEPVLKESASINFGKPGGYDAVLKRGEWGEVDTRDPAQPRWPEAEFIIGNPPFIGGKDLRDRLGGDYAEALWAANPRVPKSADFVMQWWDRAAHTLVADGSALQRFGFVTTNSITQEFSRRVIAAYLAPSSLRGGEADAAIQGATPKAGSPRAAGARDDEPEKLSLLLAIPDHPWTKATKDAAAVRIAMTVAGHNGGAGVLREVTAEAALDSDTPEVRLASVDGRINANLTVGADVTSAKPLLANEGLASPGVKLHGSGFIVTEQRARDLGLGMREGLEAQIRPYRNGRDLLQTSRGVMVIDLFGLDEKDVRQRFPELYEHLLREVKPERDRNRRETYKKNWWIFGEPRRDLRPALDGLPRYIATVETAKHRVFQFLPNEIIPDNMLIAIGSDDAHHLGVLQSAQHKEWSLRAGGTLEDRPRYSKGLIFDPFPFPDATDTQRAAIAELAEELDATRKTALAEVERLTMTELYNLREKLRAHASGGEPLSDKDQRRATAARAGIVNRLHEQLDAAVADAYGWGEEWRKAALGPTEIVARLVALNHARAAEEARGNIRWLRPDYQIPRFGPKG